MTNCTVEYLQQILPKLLESYLNERAPYTEIIPLEVEFMNLEGVETRVEDISITVGSKYVPMMVDAVSLLSEYPDLMEKFCDLHSEAIKRKDNQT